MSLKNKPRVIKWNKLLEKATLISKISCELKKKLYKRSSMSTLIWSLRTGKINLQWIHQNSDGVLTGHEETFGGEDNALYL